MENYQELNKKYNRLPEVIALSKEITIDQLMNKLLIDTDKVDAINKDLEQLRDDGYISIIRKRQDDNEWVRVYEPTPKLTQLLTIQNFKKTNLQAMNDRQAALNIYPMNTTGTESPGMDAQREGYIKGLEAQRELLRKKPYLDEMRYDVKENKEKKDLRDE